MIIKIGQTSWRTEQVLMEDFGEIDSMNALIKINSLQQQNQKIDTLLHEVLHATIETYGVPMGGVDAEEAILRTLTPALLNVLCDNPDLVDVLTGELLFY